MDPGGHSSNEPTRELSRAFEIAGRLAGLPRHLQDIALRTAVGYDKTLEAAVLSVLQSLAPLAPGSGGAGRITGEISQFGRYVLGERIGEGSMGVVFRAMHLDTGRTVALKRLRGQASQAVLDRFHSEVAMLARLRHPGIVDVVDAGHVQVGERREPYLAMDLVTGPPLLAGADDLRLDLRARVRLLVDLCGATAHAHRRGVVHRDLKPDNIRLDVDTSPVHVRILDFGVAAPLSSIRTNGAAAAGTFGYLAPEQLDGESDARGDIFSVGAIAYELVTGQRAIPAQGLSLQEALRVTRTHRPRPADEIDPRVDRDLAAVLDKALALDPEQRYPTADHLAADLRNWLAGLPVEARPATSLYLASRFVRRHPLISVTAVLLLALLGTSVTFAIDGHRTSANARDDLQTLLNGTIGELRRIADTGERPTMLPEDLTNTVAGMVERAPDDPAVRRIQADLLHLDSDLARANGRSADALDLRRRMLDTAAWLVADDASAENLRLLALAHVLVGDIHKETAGAAPPIAAQTHYSDAHDLFARVLAASPGERRARDDFGHSCLRLANLATRMGDYRQAGEWLQRAEEVVTALARDFPDNPKTHGLYREFFGINAHLAAYRGQGSPGREITARMLDHVRRARELDDHSLTTLLLHLAAARGHAIACARGGDRAVAATTFAEAEQAADRLRIAQGNSVWHLDEVFLLRVDQAEFALEGGDVQGAIRALYSGELDLLRMFERGEVPHLADRLRHLGKVVSSCLAALEALGDDERDRALLTARLLQSGFGLLAERAPDDALLRSANVRLAVLVGDEQDAARAAQAIALARAEDRYDGGMWLAEITLCLRRGDDDAARRLLAAPPTPLADEDATAARRLQERLLGR